MAAQVVLFDLDGTLVKAGGAGSRAMSMAFNDLFHRENAFARVSFTGMTDPHILKTAFNMAFNRDPTPDEAEAFFRRYIQILNQEVPRAKRYTVLPGIPELIHALTRQGLAVGLATGNLRDGARIKLERAGLWQLFGFGGFGSDSMDRTRLTQMALQRAVTLLGHAVPPGECVVVGDSPAEYKVARAMGAKVVLVATGWTDADRLQALGPDLFFNDFAAWEDTANAIADL